MKKIIIAFLMILPFMAWSQDDELLNLYKPEGGQKTLELQFQPFGSNPININGIRARWFSSQLNAFRLNVFVGVSSNSEITQQENVDLNLKELNNKNFSMSINIRPGIEKHLKGTTRLSPYFGWEGDLGYQTSSFKREIQNGDEILYTKSVNDNGYFRIGINAIAGFDFYVAKKLYLGTELGFGASYTRLLSTKVKSDRTGFEEPDPVKRGGSVHLGPNVNAQIRLGYAF